MRQSNNGGCLHVGFVLFAVAFNVALVAAAIWVIIHFVTKYW